MIILLKFLRGGLPHLKSDPALRGLPLKLLNVPALQVSGLSPLTLP